MLRKVIAISSLVFILFCQIFPQDFISGTVNQYLKVDSLYADTVMFTGDAGSFNPGDKVLLIQMTGVELIYDGGVDNRGVPNRGSRDDDHNTGKYEILQIAEIIGNKMIFTADFLHSYDNGEKIQLVRVYESDYTVISGTLTVPDWDGNTGGILAMIVFDTLQFQDNIDVRHKGFRGAQPETGFTGDCRTIIDPYDENNYDTVNFFPDEFNRAGNKGEGTVSTSFPYTKGAFWAATGGGGGNGVFAGGGGGSNYGLGGDGGVQAESCGLDYFLAAMGGIQGDDYYDNGRIVMGGGGGSGVQSSTTLASKGGDGGGIVIIAAGVLEGNGRSILADGEGITETVDASGGGGGAGGTVLIDATDFSGAMSISVRGGKGGNTGTSCTGSGGGGGGGVFWYSGQQVPSFVIDTTPGDQGTVISCSTFGNPGQPGRTYSSLLLPLNGFLFNVIRGRDTICAGKQPKIITGSNPKGGEGTYTYKWEQSADKVLWDLAVGTGADQRDFTPDTLYTTTHFRRIVHAPGAKPQADTVSKPVEIFVYPAITNNNIYGSDTICYNINPLPITGDQPAGGDGSNYQYQWQISADALDWSDTGSLLSSNQPLSPGPLTDTRYYRRYVTSTKYCSGYSDTVKLTVLPSITVNEFITSDTVICQGDSPELLKARYPANGDGSYSYLWQQKDATVWTDIPGSNMQEITVGPLATTTEYRRIVFSGNDNACIDTSDIKLVTVLDALTNNNISTDSSRYCEGDNPEIINGTPPAGGDGPGSYTYKWLINSGSVWNEIPGADGIDYAHGTLSGNIQFRRVVFSGTYDACKDTTDVLSLTVIPAIINDLDLPDDTICENNSPLPFNPPPATGGDGFYTYEWMLKPAAGGTWLPAQGTSNTAGYVPPALSDSTMFVRKVTSDICVQFSDTVNVFVYKTIKNNVITGNQLKYTCYNTSEQLTGSQHKDGNPADFAYLWQMSPNLTDWTNALGKNPNSGRDFETGDLVSPMYYRRLVLSSASGAECIDTSEHVQVLINDLPEGNLISSLDTTCAGGTVMIDYNVTGDHAPWKVKVGNELIADSTITDIPGLNSIPLVFLTGQDVSLISIVDDSLCAADLSAATEQVNVTVYEIPQADPGEDLAEVCGNHYTLSASKSITGSAGLWQTGIGTFDDASLEDATVTIHGFTSGMSEGWFKWTETNWKCADSDSIFITFYEQPVDIDAGTDQLLDFKFRTTLNAQPPLFGNGIWSVSRGEAVFDDETSPNANVSGLDFDNILVWTVTNGICPSTQDSISIIVRDLELPLGITPGSGTSAELFKIEIENAERIELIIFNRLGQVVFEESDYNETNFWDGTHYKNHAELPEGTYFYVLKVKIEGKEKEFPPFKKYIELVRP
ncbi:MAG: gliding motility-associated C-terminal domain-containing protein [Bacteroidales bacterium]|nr:gliding motility-associated C-terminal domain-containing protein [Bacteroidales bacterium]